MIHADAQLARRLEAVICAEWRRLARTARSLWPEKQVTYLDIAGGVALWMGPASLVNVAVGVAMNGPIAEDELRQVEDFYTRRGVPPILATCPFADPTLFTLLGRRGWRVTEFENVLARELDGPPGWPDAAPPQPPSGIEAHACAGPERKLWGQLAACGFSDEAEPGPGHEEFGAIMAARPDTILVLGYADGQPAATGGLVIDGDVAWLMADSTLPGYRRRGMQLAIQRHRLEIARKAGCRLAVTESAPGSGSQRNMERLGFRVVYAHLEYGKV
jgi:hypothetical protein